MAICTPGPLTGRISGTVGHSITFASARGTQVLRSAQRPRTKNTPTAINRQAGWAHFALKWKTLTDEERATYATIAAAVTFPNALGISRNISPFQFYMRLNLIRWPNLTSVKDISTPSLALPAPTKVVAAFWEGGPFTINWTDPGGNVDKIRFFAARNVRTTPSYNHYWRQLDADTTSALETKNLYPPFLEILGDPAATEVVSVRTVSFTSEFFYSPAIDINITIQ